VLEITAGARCATNRDIQLTAGGERTPIPYHDGCLFHPCGGEFCITVFSRRAFSCDRRHGAVATPKHTNGDESLNGEPFMRNVASCIAVLVLYGCANPYAQFYRGTPDARTVANYVPPEAPLRIYSTNNFARDIELLERRGLAPIGESSFNAAASRVSERQLRAQAEKLGAAVVLVASQYTGTVAGAMPLLVPNNSTSYTTGSATVVGPGGVANVAGSATTNTYGSQVVMMPYAIRRADFDAVYFVKVHQHFGVFYGVIDDATRARLQTNAGVLIKTVVEGSPAALADILPGDIILAIDGERVDSREMFNAEMKTKLGRETTLTIDRNGQRIEKKVTPSP
jgi:PDZ domain